MNESTAGSPEAPDFYVGVRCQQILAMACDCVVRVGQVRVELFPGLGVIVTLPNGDQEIVNTPSELLPHVSGHLAREWNRSP